MLLFLLRGIITAKISLVSSSPTTTISRMSIKTYKKNIYIKNNLSHTKSTYMYLINFLLITILSLSFIPSPINGQDFYGASYANNRGPDEIRQRARNNNNNGFDDPSTVIQESGGGNNEIGAAPVPAEINEPRPGCQGPWQWQCDSGHCIAQYDLCDGVTQCPDESDEKNCRGRFGPSQHISSYRQQPDPVEPKKPATKSSTTDLPKTTLFPGTKNAGSMYLPLKLVFAGAAAFILVAGLAHVFVKRRNVQATVRNYRKGHSTVDDEDDLLISQMYS